MKRLIYHICASVSVLTFTISSIASPHAGAAPASLLSHVIISEVQPEGLSAAHAPDGKREFIELYNPTDEPLSLEGMRLEYLSAAHDGTGLPTRILADLSGMVAPYGYALISARQYFVNATFYFTEPATSLSGLMALSGGHVRLTNPDGAVLDLVGWGSAKKIGMWWSSPVMQAGMSIQRLLPDDSGFQESGLAYAVPSFDTTPEGNEPARLPSDTEEPPVTEPPAHLPCATIELSEILPNAKGVDAGSEFIEIFNPSSQPISLKGCSIRVGLDGPVFLLPDEIISAGQYRAFYDSESGLNLPNATAQKVYLLSQAEQKEALYANAMPEGAAWARLNGQWNITQTPTPGFANMPAPVPPRAENSEQQSLCPAGKERNPETNRCRTISVATTSPIQCRTGQEINPSTKRCRKAAVSLAVTPCHAGQVRNPETNRCRAVAGSVKSLTDCAPGQERNPQTNRCRKVAGDASRQFASIQDVSTKTGDGLYRWWIAAMAVACAIGYALYEWRSDIRNGIYRWLGRHRRPKVRK